MRLVAFSLVALLGCTTGRSPAPSAPPASPVSPSSDARETTPPATWTVQADPSCARFRDALTPDPVEGATLALASCELESLASGWAAQRCEPLASGLCVDGSRPTSDTSHCTCDPECTPCAQPPPTCACEVGARSDRLALVATVSARGERFTASLSVGASGYVERGVRVDSGRREAAPEVDTPPPALEDDALLEALGPGIRSTLHAAATILAAPTDAEALARCAEVAHTGGLTFEPAARRCTEAHTRRDEAQRAARDEARGFHEVHVDTTPYPVRLDPWSEAERDALRRALTRLGWTVEVDDYGLLASARGPRSALDTLARDFGTHLGLLRPGRVEAGDGSWWVTDGAIRASFVPEGDTVVLRARAWPIRCPTGRDAAWYQRFEGVRYEADLVTAGTPCDPAGPEGCRSTPPSRRTVRGRLDASDLRFERQVLARSVEGAMELRCAVVVRAQPRVRGPGQLDAVRFTPPVPELFDAYEGEPLER
ncbi:MAG: hypothetical protein R3B99_16640 [Polyangiales bacterium]|nr:hypothetical protein [Myxococcales bacterium]